MGKEESYIQISNNISKREKYELYQINSNIRIISIIILLMRSINCAFHPKELIVNFCRNSSCLLPMCPNCVKLHSKYHTAGNTFGEFYNIHEVYEEVELNLQNVLKGLVNFNYELKEVFCEKQACREEIKKRMGEYRMKVLSSIERYIDQLYTYILNTMGGHASNIEDEFSKINEKIELISRNVEKEFRTLNGEKTLKGIITHFNKNMAKFYDYKLDYIMTEIGDIKSKDLYMCKEFRINQLMPIHYKIHEVYKSIFVGTINPKTFKSRYSRVSNSSRASTTK